MTTCMFLVHMFMISALLCLPQSRSWQHRMCRRQWLMCIRPSIYELHLSHRKKTHRMEMLQSNNNNGSTSQTGKPNFTLRRYSHPHQVWNYGQTLLCLQKHIRWWPVNKKLHIKDVLYVFISELFSFILVFHLLVGVEN